MVETGTILWPWEWRVGTAAVLFLTAGVYVHGWQQLYHPRHPGHTRTSPQAATIRSLALFSSGLILLGFALSSPVNQLAAQFFFVHVTQHLLLIAWIPCLLLVGKPLPTLTQGLPTFMRQHGWQWWQTHPAWLTAARRATSPGFVWISFAGAFWLAYDPVTHRFLQQYVWAQPIEKFVLLVAGMLYWWHIIGASPLHAPMPRIARILYALAGAAPIKGVGLVLLFTQTAVYPYSNSFRLSGLDINDQQLGGILIWIVGGTVFSWTSLILMRHWLSEEDEKPLLPETAWATEETMLAPGIRQQTVARVVKRR